MAAIQLATAASGTLVPLAIAEIGASQEAASLAASAYSAGFLIGCFLVARSIDDYGHIRAFAAGAALTTAAAIFFTQVANAPFLIFLRFMTGLATASLFSIGDAWINESTEKMSRGKVLAIYAILIGLVSVFSQAIVIVVPEDISQAFIFVALIYCFSIIVISTTRSNPPKSEARANIRIKGLFQDAPAAVAGVFVIGMVSTIILSVAPYSASQLGIGVRDIALIIGAIYLGRVLFQYPLGVLSDKMDRRVLIFFTSCVCAGVLLVMAIIVEPNPAPIADEFDYLSVSYFVLMALMVLLGGSLLTLYSLLSAHALDRTVPVYVSSAAVTMLFVWTIGSVVGPLFVSIFTSAYGDGTMHWVNFAVMLTYLVFLGFKIWTVEAVSPAEQTQNVFFVQTSTEMTPTEKR
ncbi:MFS transporter [Ruegeria pomeroyi]|nr:MFS transporter [Ruegeria pomeroyi]